MTFTITFNEVIAALTYLTATVSVSAIVYSIYQIGVISGEARVFAALRKARKKR